MPRADLRSCRPETDPGLLLAVLLAAAGGLAYATAFVFQGLPRIYAEIFFALDPGPNAWFVIQLGLGQGDVPQQGLLAPPAFFHKRPQFAQALILRQLAAVIEIGGQALTAERSLAGAFADTASQPDGVEAGVAALFANRCDELVDHALGHHFAFAEQHVPGIVFTDPEIAWAGLTENQAKKKKINYKRVIKNTQDIGP